MKIFSPAMQDQMLASPVVDILMFLDYFRAPKPWESLTQEPRPGMRSLRWESQNSSENVTEYHISKNFKNHNWHRHQHHQGWDHKLLHWRGCQSTWGFRLLPQIRWWSWRESENPGKQCKNYESKFIKYFLWTVCDQNQLTIFTNRETTWETWQKSNCAGELLPDFQRLPSRKCPDR